MNVPRWALLFTFALAAPIFAPVCCAQADFSLHATPVAPAAPDPAIAGALQTIKRRTLKRRFRRWLVSAPATRFPAWKRIFLPGKDYRRCRLDCRAV